MLQADIWSQIIVPWTAAVIWYFGVELYYSPNLSKLSSIRLCRVELCVHAVQLFSTVTRKLNTVCLYAFCINRTSCVCNRLNPLRSYVYGHLWYAVVVKFDLLFVTNFTAPFQWQKEKLSGLSQLSGAIHNSFEWNRNLMKHSPAWFPSFHSSSKPW